MIKTFLLLLFCLSSYATPVYISFPSDVDWRQIDSTHFHLLYREGSDKLAKKALYYAEENYKLLSPIFPQTPPTTWIVLADFQDSLNGYAIDFPWPHMVIYTTPPEPSGQLASLDDWLKSVILHEYVHVLHLYPANHLWKVLRFIFGSTILPNGLMPSHFHEGLAVLLETELTKGGRGKSPYFNMLRRKAVEAKQWSLDQFTSLDRMDGATTLWPTGTSPYFFGFYLYEDLWQKKGAAGIKELVTKYSSNWPYLLNGPLEDVYGVDFTTHWKNVYEKTTASSLKEIEEIKKDNLSEIKYLTPAYFSKSYLEEDKQKNKIYYKAYTPEEGSLLNELDLNTQKIKTLSKLNSFSEGLCLGKYENQNGFYFLDSSDAYLYSYKVLYFYNTETNKKESLLGNKGLLQIGCDKNSDEWLGYKYVAGVGTIEKYKNKNVVEKWALPSDAWVGGLTLSKTAYIVLRQGMDSHFYSWQSGSEPKKFFELTANVFNLKQIDNKLYFIADLSKRNEVWSLDLSTKKLIKEVAVLGGIHSFSKAEQDFYISSYEHGGYGLAKVIKRVPSEKNVPTQKQTALSSNENSIEATSKTYSAFSTILPTTWIPAFLIVPNGLQFSVWLPAFDISQKHLYDIFAGYDTRGTFFGSLNYTYRFAKSWDVSLNPYLFPNFIISTGDIFSQWGGSLVVGKDFFGGNLRFELGPVFNRTENSRLTPANNSVGVAAKARLELNVKKRPISISYTQGTVFQVSYSQFIKGLGSDDNYFSTTASVEQFLESFWLREHIFYLKIKGGYTEGTNLFNSFFQAGGNLLIYQYQSSFLNRGYLPGMFIARRIINANLEYRFPIATIERGLSLWPIKLKRIHGALVADASTSDLGTYNPLDGTLVSSQNFLRRAFVSAGVELKSDWTIFFYMPASVKLGVYHGFSDFGETVYFNMGIEAAL